ncbi:WGR domain-containing protein [Oceaniovalibus sp. ACAM 378]|uniref:WGR domain-containing protein n=1 Tax=Oceaniovalibus sp. ACAM 378 TaxID=2599923 RepID=UPI0011D35CC5|nr:WGR domain-containing protein [Oceaniovalibus sp. ACAM 378]TYB84641.1 WGR domain-containing protein [Oceaniovalibus sp. ACAM 378]
MTTDPRQLEIFPDSLILRRVEPEQNMRRFYLMTVQRDLFGRGALITEFGRIGQAGQVKIAHHEDEARALAALADRAKAKRKRGYQE